ncbi:MAG: DinB family protein [Bacteroidota bacterium]
MKKSLIVLTSAIALFAGCAQPNENGTQTRDVLAEQFRTTFNKKEWFAPLQPALEDLTAEQAMWKDSSGNHSIGQLAHHLAFWNGRQLAKFKGEQEAAFSGNNEETFNDFDKESWEKTVAAVGSISSEWEKEISTADPKKLEEWYATLANINVHNAYHTGQIIYIRKMKGWWNPEKGVK